MPGHGLKSFAIAFAVVAGTQMGAPGTAAQKPAHAPERPAAPRATTVAPPTARRASRSPALTPAWRAFYAGDLDRAATLANTALQVNPAHTGARLVLVRLAMERGDAEKAYLELRRAQRYVPDDPDVLYYLAIVSGDLARNAFDTLYKLAPESARVHQLMAESLEAQDKSREAEAEYEAALRADPHLLDPLLALGRLKRIRLACDEAIPLYERAETIRPTFDGAFGLGTCLAVQQDDERAILQFKKALTHDPRSAVAWAGLGTALGRAGQSADGITALQRAVAIEPDLSEAHYALGLAYRKAGDEQRANAAFEKARALQSGSR